MHTNPFTPAGYDLTDLRNRVDRKADEHELYSLRSDVARLERAIGELRVENDGLRRRCERLEESCQEQIDRWQEDNGQFGVGA